MTATTPVVAQSATFNTATISIPKQGQVLGLACSRQTGFRGTDAFTWAGLTEMYDLHTTSSNTVSYLTQSGATSGLLPPGDLTATTTIPSIQGNGLSLATFRNAKYDRPSSPVKYLGVSTVVNGSGMTGVVEIPELPTGTSAVFVLTGGNNSPLNSVTVGGSPLRFLGNATNTRNVTTGNHNFSNSSSTTGRQVSCWLLPTVPPDGSYPISYTSPFTSSFSQMRVLFLQNVAGIVGSEQWQGATSSFYQTIADPNIPPLILPGAIVIYSVVIRGSLTIEAKYESQTAISTFQDKDGVGGSHLITASSTIPVGVESQLGYYAAYTLVLR